MYYWQIIEVLTAYVRENAPWPHKTKKNDKKDSDQLPVDIPEPPADIQAILSVLGRRRLAYLKGEDHRLVLYKTNLQKITTREAKLQGAHLGEAKLQGVYLGKANLEGADMQGVEELTFEQLCTTQTLYKVKGLNPELLVKIKEKCPHLLEKPTRKQTPDF